MSKDTRKNLYTVMDNTYKYSCPYRNSTYHTINNGVNCLCTKYNGSLNKSTSEKVFINGKK
jgi:hypothetical protein